MIAEKYYHEFDYLKEVTYLDVASAGLQPRRTLDFCREFQDRFAGEYGRSCFDGSNQKSRDHTAELLAQLIHCGRDEIMFTANTTEGNSLLVNSLKLSAGDSVITTDIEFPSVMLGWVQKQETGMELQVVQTENGAFDAEKVISLMDESTRVVALSLRKRTWRS